MTRRMTVKRTKNESTTNPGFKEGDHWKKRAVPRSSMTEGNSKKVRKYIERNTHVERTRNQGIERKQLR